MKRFQDLKFAEIVRLTETEIDNLVRIEIAEAGIAFVDRPVEPEYDQAAPVPTIVGHEVAGLIFLDRAVAEKLLDLEIYDDAYEYALGGYDRRFLKKVEPTVETKKFYRKEDLEDNRQVIAANKAKKDEYEANLKNYNNFIDKTARFEKDIYGKYWAVLSLQRQIEEAYKRFSCYLTLAEDDRGIAANFFRKAYPNWLQRIVIDGHDIDLVLEEEAP
jgi:hypothetical protein